MPIAISLAHKLSRKLTEVRENGTLPYLRPDGKTQVSVKYENGKFSVDYQQEYLRFLLNAKMNSHYAFVFARNEEYNHFQNNYGKHFQR